MSLRASKISPAVSLALLLSLLLLAGSLEPRSAVAQSVTDGSDAAIGQADTRKILDLIKTSVKDPEGAKVTSLRRSKGPIVCGSVNVKNKNGLYLGERGFVVDLSIPTFGRMPDGPELLDPRVSGFAEKEKIRELYFDMCLD